ncbi:MAG: hypothetical protein ACE5HS_07705 [bacterium]
MVNRVDLRINNVNLNEITELNSLISTLHNPSYQDDVVHSSDGHDAYVVTVTPANLQRIKDALRIILRIVNAERIAIET